MPTFKKIAIGTVSAFILLGAVLMVHIYMVTRPKAPDEHTIVMARVDIKQPITEEQGDELKGWLYRQQGIDHVLYNAASQILVFTYYPVKTDPNKIITGLKSKFNLVNAQRHVLTDAEKKNGCPVAVNSFSTGAYNFIKHIF